MQSLCFTTFLLFDALTRGCRIAFACLLLLLSCARLIHAILYFTVAAAEQKDCVAGQYFDINSQTCKTCAPGFASKQQSAFCVEVYISCAPGQYVEFSDEYCYEAQCRDCVYSSNYYCPTGRGLYDPSISASSVDYMVPCPDGTYSSYSEDPVVQCTSTDQSGSDCPPGSIKRSGENGCFAW